MMNEPLTCQVYLSMTSFTMEAISIQVPRCSNGMWTLSKAESYIVTSILLALGNITGLCLKEAG